MRQATTKAQDKRWARELFGQAELGDQRRTKRLVKLATDLAHDKGATVPQACGKEAAAQEAAYRFIRNEAIEPAQIGRAAYQATAKRAGEHQTMVEIQDSTTLSYHHAAPTIPRGRLRRASSSTTGFTLSTSESSRSIGRRGAGNR